jgi:hypothetical protein
MTLQDWLRSGHLTRHKTSPEEIWDLRSAAARALRDCRIAGLSADWCLNIAHSSALRMATAALAASGYRASRDQHHVHVIRSLELTAGADAGLIGLLDRFRKKRNVGTYERPGTALDCTHDARRPPPPAAPYRSNTIFSTAPYEPASMRTK